jgi:hypothetical protein
VKRTIALGGALALGLSIALAAPAQAATATIHVPSDFDPLLGDTRATGHYELQGTALHVWTDGTLGVGTSTDKVAEYVDTNTPLAGIGEPSMSLTPISGTVPPGYQLQIDFDNDGSIDGILVGEPTFYGTNWWLNNGADADVKAGAPHTGGGSGSLWYGTLNEWRANFPNAVVKAFGFSLGSGVIGDWLINSIQFNGTTYTFAADVTLHSKDDCKNGGWVTSTNPAYKNQGECVSSFAKNK